MLSTGTSKLWLGTILATIATTAVTQLDDEDRETAEAIDLGMHDLWRTLAMGQLLSEDADHQSDECREEEVPKPAAEL